MATRTAVEVDPDLSMFDDIPDAEVLEQVAAGLRAMDEEAHP